MLVNGHGGIMAGLSVVATGIATVVGMPVYTTAYFIGPAREIAQVLEEQKTCSMPVKAKRR
ncbi:hypothetical protein [Agrobacterium bohemicum]|uniref:Uncharacterized protein n=1 Tax=Agrobacterium bohemicum TaxID=2052828 RepID=A0A135NY23_9HYPH|nr:hypothetical protein [Agrobacterium bohemicum]KXG84078.1 hypothetical protein ATO67_13780 [Agrobacterium bohemicum]